MKASDVRQMKSLALAYIGDAIYEVYVREQLLERGTIKPNQLHQAAIRYVSGKSQAKVILHWLEQDAFLTEEESRVVIRGEMQNQAVFLKILMYRRIVIVQRLKR